MRATEKQGLCGRLICVMIVLLLSTAILSAAESEHHYRMTSTITYSGQGQYSNHVESLFTVRQNSLGGDKVKYFVSGKDVLDELSFVVDRKSQHLSGVGQDSAFWAELNNSCVESLAQVSRDSAGKTWKQSFDLSSASGNLPGQLAFTMTAMIVDSSEYGEMLAVRALSEPFFVNLEQGKLACRNNTVYLFDSEIEEIYLSVSVFEASTAVNGFKEVLRHEVATCKAEGNGDAIDLKGLGGQFERFVAKVGVTKDYKVEKAVSLPGWAKAEGMQTAQASSMCSALSCEGAMNPVVTVTMPAANVAKSQSSEPTTVSSQLAAPESGGGFGPWEWLVDKVGFWPAVGITGGVVGGSIAAAGGGGGGGGGAASP